MKTYFLAAVPVAILSMALTTTGTAQSAAPRPPIFGTCAACHATEVGKTSYGPNLHGVAGRKAGSQPGYAYSPALKASGLAWDRATLDAWLTSPQKKVPGNKMPFAGIPDPAKRKQVIDYLMALK